MEISIVNNGNTSHKLTVTSDNKVRIKLKADSDLGEMKFIPDRLIEIAKDIVENGLNTTTLRGKVSSRQSLTMLNGKKETVKCYKL